jgi:O-antigen/teichoic acid export membrane protein
MLGQAGARLVALVSIPFVSRLYTPDVVGSAATLIALTSFVAPSLSLRLNMAIVRPAKNEEALEVLALSFIIACAFAFCLQLFSLIAICFISFPQSHALFFFTPLIALLISLRETLQFFASRQKRYGLIATNEFSQNIVYSVTRISLGYVLPTAGALGVSYCLQIAFGCLNFVLNLHFQDICGHLTRAFGKRRIILARYVNYIRYRLPAYLLFSGATHAPIIFFSMFVDLDFAGQYSMAAALISAPVSLITQSISRLFYAEIAAEVRSGKTDIRSEILHRRIWIFLAAVCVSFALFLFSPIFARTVLGDAWKDASRICGILGAVAGLQIVASPLMSIFDLVDNQARALILHFTRFSLVMGAFITTVTFGLSGFTSVLTLSVALAVFYLAAIISAFIEISSQVGKSS